MSTARLPRIIFVVSLVVLSMVYVHYRVHKPLREQRSRSSFVIDIENCTDCDNLVPVAVLGSGPAGLSAAIYGARANMHTVVFEGRQPGGQLTQTSYVENWPGIAKKMGADIMKQLKEQAAEFGAVTVPDAVTSLNLSEWPFTLQTEEGYTIKALTVVIATGASPRYLGVPGEKEYWGKGVTACAICDGPFYKKSDVMVIGGGDSAVEEALQLAPYANSVTMMVRKDALRAAPAMQAKLKAYDHISIQFNKEIKEVLGDAAHVNAVKVFDNKTKKVTQMPIDAVFLAIGHEPNNKLFVDQLATTPGGYLAMGDRTQATSVSGVYAAGDVEDFRYRQAGVASGSGIKAALDAVNFLSEIGYNAKRQASLEHLLFDGYPDRESLVRQVSSMSELNDELSDAKGKPVVIDFFAPYCPSCMQMIPVFEAVSHKLGSVVTFLKVDASLAQDIARKYEVPKVPCMLIIKDKQIIARYTDTLDKKQLYELIKKVL